MRIVAPASPVEEDRLRKGCAELARLGYVPRWDTSVLAQRGYFAGSADERSAKLQIALEEKDSTAVVCARGGYGSNYLIERLNLRRLKHPKILMGYSDITTLQCLLWRKLRWVTFYGPMAAAGFDAGADAPHGYDLDSLMNSITQTQRSWTIDLDGEKLFAGMAEGVLLGGCLTLLTSALGTQAEIETRGSILVLEDRGMKPWQVDRAIMQLKLAGKLSDVRGIILGEFPECDPPAGSASVRDTCRRLLAPLKICVVWGARVGHTERPMLTIPLGVRARLSSGGAGRLEILEVACAAPTLRLKRGKQS
ncbi:MAG: S66 peptidase family protein [Candidatus Acidiferrales bacterium]